MPQTFNLPNSIDGLNANVRSVRCWFYLSPWGGYPQPPTPMPTVVAEIADPALAHFCIFEGFDKANVGGNSLGRGSLDTGTETLQDHYKAVGLVAILQAAFGEP